MKTAGEDCQCRSTFEKKRPAFATGAPLRRGLPRFVDLLLTWGLVMQKPRDEAGRM